MNYDKIVTLKARVESVLQNVDESRNNDITLLIEVWKRFYPDVIRTGNLFGDHVLLKDLYELPREDSIKRIRAEFQNDHAMYVPTRLDIAKLRGIAEDEWRVAMGYPTKKSTGTDSPSWTPPSRKKKKVKVDKF